MAGDLHQFTPHSGTILHPGIELPIKNQQSDGIKQEAEEMFRDKQQEIVTRKRGATLYVGFLEMKIGIFPLGATAK
ncbi:hypothetical protein [Burkholderia sp. 3C]